MQEKGNLVCGRFYFCLQMLIHLKKKNSLEHFPRLSVFFINSVSLLSLEYSLCDAVWNLESWAQMADVVPSDFVIQNCLYPPKEGKRDMLFVIGGTVIGAGCSLFYRITCMLLDLGLGPH